MTEYFKAAHPLPIQKWSKKGTPNQLLTVGDMAGQVKRDLQLIEEQIQRLPRKPATAEQKAELEKLQLQKRLVERELQVVKAIPDMALVVTMKSHREDRKVDFGAQGEKLIDEYLSTSLGLVATLQKDLATYGPKNNRAGTEKLIRDYEEGIEAAQSIKKRLNCGVTDRVLVCPMQ